MTDEMDYSDIVSQLMGKIPELKNVPIEDDDLQELPHCFFDMIFTGAVISACKNKDKTFLVKAGEFMEQMALCHDVRVRELLNVSLLEPLVLEKENVIPILRDFLGRETLKELDYWQRRYHG